MSAHVGTTLAFRGAMTLSMGLNDDGWLERFHAGERGAIEECYREHYAGIDRVVGGVLRGADRETVIHELFYRLLTKPDLRRSYSGGSLPAWLHTLARNQAIDLLRRTRRDVPLESIGTPTTSSPLPDDELDAKRLIARFRQEVLPAAWAPVFEKRFLEQLNQREAAQKLGISRTTLAYRELRIRSMLKKFLLRGDES